MSQDEIKDVQAFHQRFGMVVGGDPGHLTRRYVKERIDLIQEELNELKDAADRDCLVDQLDALVDMVYVIKGTAVAMGFTKLWRAAWNEVQRANMSKERGVGPRGNKVDAVKPAGWLAPRLGALLKWYGYNPLDWIDEVGQVMDGRDNEEDRP